MELTLKRLLEQAEFAKAKRGYDADEVDEFLDRAVAMAAKVEVRLTQALEQAKDAGSAPAGPAPAEVEAEVERRVQARLAEQPAVDRPSGASEEEAAEEVRRTIVLAQRTADAAVREAREDAARLLAEARERADALNDEADNALTVARQEVARQIEIDRRAAQERLAAEIADLEGIRESLRSDVTVLERHVTEQRDQLRSSVGELQRVLDDPAGFRLAPTPALLDPDIPSPIVTAGTTASSGADTVAAGRSDDEDRAATDEAPPSGEPPAAAGDGPGTAEPERPEPRSGGPGAAPGGDGVSFGEVDHAAPGVPEASYGGPPTAPVSAVDLGGGGHGDGGDRDEDAFLTELRKAMADDEPLGPRSGSGAAPSGFAEDEGRGWRFGKRR
jgi:DivIVA domain-containing protein